MLILMLILIFLVWRIVLKLLDHQYSTVIGWEGPSWPRGSLGLMGLIDQVLIIRLYTASHWLKIRRLNRTTCGGIQGPFDPADQTMHVPISLELQ